VTDTTKTSTGGGLNSGRYSDYQQQLIDMLDGRKDEAKSDKWMALAQAGMSLMQGGTGSFGGDLGKAGQTGLAALQESNKSARQDRFGVLKTLADIDATNRSLQIQAQAASQKGTLNPKDYVTMYQATADRGHGYHGRNWLQMERLSQGQLIYTRMLEQRMRRVW
jgi:hypothetical protein